MRNAGRRNKDDVLVMSFLIYAAAGLLSGLLGGMGMGGGTIMIPALTVFCGVGQHAAQVTNLISFLPMSAFSIAIHKKQGLIRADGLFGIILPAVLTSVVGSLIALLLPAGILRRLFGAFLVVLAIRGAINLLPTGKKSGKL